LIRFLAFSIKRAWQGFWRNIVMSLAATATMVLMLLLLAGLLIVVTGLNAGLDYFESKVEVTAFVRDGASQQRIDEVLTKVRGLPEVAAVTFVTKDEALQRFREYNAARGQPDLVDVLPSNPLPASIEVDLSDPLVYAQVAGALEDERDVVDNVVENQSVVNALLIVTDRLRLAGMIVLGLVGLTVFFIVINTIRLAVVARAREIEIMRLVGASDAFIRWPFIFEGIFVGLVGATVTLGLLALAYEPLSRAMFAIFEVLPLRFGEFVVRDVAVVVLGTGVGLGAIGSWVAVRSYLGR
jgi:cell division transport system permease protein